VAAPVRPTLAPEALEMKVLTFYRSAAERACVDHLLSSLQHERAAVLPDNNKETKLATANGLKNEARVGQMSNVEHHFAKNLQLTGTKVNSSNMLARHDKYI
jgi:hypothetical protein